MGCHLILPVVVAQAKSKDTYICTDTVHIYMYTHTAVCMAEFESF